MKKFYYIVCAKYKKFKKHKILNIFEKALAFYIACSKCASEEKRIFKEEESIEILNIVDLIINIKEYQNKYD